MLLLRLSGHSGAGKSRLTAALIPSTVAIIVETEATSRLFCNDAMSASSAANAAVRASRSAGTAAAPAAASNNARSAPSGPKPRRRKPSASRRRPRSSRPCRAPADRFSWPAASACVRPCQ